MAKRRILDLTELTTMPANPDDWDKYELGLDDSAAITSLRLTLKTYYEAIKTQIFSLLEAHTQSPAPATKAGRTDPTTVSEGFESYPVSNGLRYVVVNDAWVWDPSFIPVLTNVAELDALTELEDKMIVRFDSAITIDTVVTEDVRYQWTTADGWRQFGARGTGPVVVEEVISEQIISIAAGGAIAVDYNAGQYVKFTGVAASPLTFTPPTNMALFKVAKWRFAENQTQSVTFDQTAGNFVPLTEDAPALGVAGVRIEIEREPEGYTISQNALASW